MKRKLNLHFMTVTAIAVFLTLILSLFVSYDMVKEQVNEEIKSYAWLLKDVYEHEGIDTQSFEKLRDNVRITVVAPDGSVLYDNFADEKQMENHADREEIAQAVETGEGYAVRNSDTLSENLFYYAVRTDDGGVVRASKQASSAFGLLQRIVPLLIGVVILLIALCVVIAGVITRRIIAPIEDVGKHMDNLETVEVYDELRPFVETINKQHRDIMKNATMRQDFTANVTHELKTPLTSISGYAELIENGMVDEQNIVKFAVAIHKNADRLLTLINDIIRLSELDGMQSAPEFEEIDLYQQASSTAQLLEMTARKQQVSISVAGTSQVIRGNRQMIEELIYNLCDNAIRYNRPGGMVEIEVYRERRGVVLSVKDNGIGIPPEHQDRIFERFYRVDKSRSKERGGTGLGLAIVKHIAQVHNASLEVISQPEIGTQILVVF